MARLFGVVGAGGAGFPTHVKLDTQVEYVVVNGAECEPLLEVDQALLISDSPRLAAVLEEVRQAVGAREARIAIKARHREAVATAQAAAASYPGLSLVPLGDFYPAGDEFVLVYETTGRLVPQGGIPLQVKVVVLNVETLWNLAEARAGRPVTHKWVTVTGAVTSPGTFRVPLGVSTAEMIALAGGTTVSDFAVLNGGSMMGRLVETLNEPVTKTTKGLVVLPATSPVVRVRAQPLAAILRQARAACCQCQECTDLCPRHLLGHELSPHKVMLAASYAGSPVAALVTAAFLCSECGVCDLYACPMGLSPRRVSQALKEELTRQGVKNPHKGVPAGPHPWRPYRRVPLTRLLPRLGLKPYELPAPVREADVSPERVVLPLRQHMGAPAEPVVKVGDKVEAGQLLAETPAGKIGSRLFASISGYVAERTPAALVLTDKPREGGGQR
ncbi:MAG: electron transport complex protein RnfC [Firmicutes bacterium]|nr:electron transport complex protein RnfC [Bacillota bacterium]